MFPRLALLPLGLFIIWGFICHNWYVCHIKMACGDEVVIDDPPPTEPVEDTRPLVFSWDDATPVTRASFEAFKAGRLEGVVENTMLELTGLYFPGENAPEGFANMGLARASKVADLFSPPLDRTRIVETSRLLTDVPPGIQGDTMFESIEFNVISSTPVDTVEIVEVDNTITILFPYGSSVREPDPRVDKYLAKLATRLSQTEETVSITGHTDSAGSVEFNQQLGLARAKHIQAILIDKGVAAGRLSVDSKGESEPVASNATEEGSRQNRRVVLVLNANET